MSARLKRRGFFGDHRGATALEFAFVLPVFVALVFGVFEFGLAQHRLASLRFAMNTVSREILLNPALDQTQVSTKVKALLDDIADPNVTVTLQTLTTASGTIARMTGVYAADIGIPTVATYPLSYTTTVDVALPDA